MTDTGPKAEAKANKARAKAQRPWYKKKRWLGLIVLAAIVVVALAGGGGEDSPEPVSEGGDTAAEDTAAEEPERVGMNTPASDGQFTFVVSGLECGQTSIGTGAMAEDAQGQWCVLTATVENTGDEPQALSASAQRLYDDQGREFEATVPLAVSGESPIYEQINPGNEVEGRFFFDVPEGFTPSHVELHDSAMSGGVQVDLS